MNVYERRLVNFRCRRFILFLLQGFFDVCEDHKDGCFNLYVKRTYKHYFTKYNKETFTITYPIQIHVD